MQISHLIALLINRQDLTYNLMQDAMKAIMSGEVDDIQIAGFLTALTTKGETVDEILAGAEVMRDLATPVPVIDSEHLVDPVGTGGTNSRVFNVSTASAIVSACAGVKIAKHGGRAASSKSGSADFLEFAGINIDVSPDDIDTCISECGIGFMFAPNLHAAMRHVGPVRKVLGVRTIFNLLGPLTNPSGAKRQVLGVFDKSWLAPMAEVSKRLGKTAIMVVHSQDGLDEISIAAPTDVVEFDKRYTIHPQDYGIYHDNLNDVRVDSAEHSFTLITKAFNGEKGAGYDMIALNSAAILLVSGLYESYATALDKAKEILDNGQAQQKLDEYAKLTQSLRNNT